MNRVKILIILLLITICPICFYGCDKSKTTTTPQEEVEQVDENLEEDEEGEPQLNTFTGISMGSQTITYDGEAHSMLVTGEVPQGAVVTYTEPNEFTEPGTYYVTAIVSKEGYQDLVLPSYITIAPIKVSLEITNYIYDYTGSSVDLIYNCSNSNISVDVETATDAGLYITTFMLNDKTHYSWANGSTDDYSVNWIISREVTVKNNSNVITTFDLGATLNDVADFLETEEFNDIVDDSIESITFEVDGDEIILFYNDSGVWRINPLLAMNDKVSAMINGERCWIFAGVDGIIAVNANNAE